jgi:BMFP domain-containing protein YqiC
MENFAFLEDLHKRMSDLLAQTPAADLQRNLKALLTQQFAQLDLITREEFDVQCALLEKTRARVDALEARLAQLEK